MSRSSNERVSREEVLLQELCEKLNKEFGNQWSDEKMDKVVEICNWYADKKIELMFKQQEDKNKGMVKTRGDGVGFIGQEEFFKKVK